MGYYILEGKEPKKISDITEWAKKLDKANTRVDQTEIGGINISTVFLGLDHSHCSSIPILFETMIFGGEHDGYQERYATWDEAVEGHKAAVEKVNVKK